VSFGKGEPSIMSPTAAMVIDSFAVGVGVAFTSVKLTESMLTAGADWQAVRPPSHVARAANPSAM